MELNIQKEDRILVVAPHPDDESIGCGGLLSIYGKQCDVLVLTDGDNRREVSNIAEIREQEFERAVASANVNNYICLRLPERQIEKYKKTISDIGLEKYHHVFVPNRHDEHEDHVKAYQVIKSLVRRNCKLYEYEVWSPLQKPNIYLDISAVAERKIAMIKEHESQVKELDYVGMIMGLNAYRGRSHQMDFAECYFCQKERRQQLIRRAKRKVKGIVK